MNARFWTYWNGGYVKLTVRPGQDVNLYRGGQHEEGFSEEGIMFHLFEDGELSAEAWSNGRDCDGRHSSSQEFGTTLTELLRAAPTRDNPDPDNQYRERTPPNWQYGAGRQRDYFAEAAGY